MIEFLNVLLLLFLPFLFIGIINRVKAVFAGRQGPPLLQSFYDFVKLLQKGSVVSRTTSLVFQLGSSVMLTSTILAGLLIPIINHQSVLSFAGDFIFFVYILAMGKFFMILSAMDTGSSFEGMGSSRESTYSLLAEPAFFVVLASFYAIHGMTSFHQLITQFQEYKLDVSLMIAIPTSIVLFIMMLVEGCRVPVDDPNTHLELTMVHEVMILDHSGPDLAFMNYSAGMKMVILGSLIANLLIPTGIAIILNLIFVIGIILIAGILIGIIESLNARLRLIHVPQFIGLMSSIALGLLAIVIIFIRKPIP